MIVPQYWAEGRVRGVIGRHRVTVRRFGWSDASLDDAQLMADTRAQEAFQRLSRGEKARRYEPKIPYNGAEGVPIREEIVSRHGEAVVTRNIYGARCLNTPDVLFADIDFEGDASPRTNLAMFGLLLLGAAAVGWAAQSWGYCLIAGLLALGLGNAAANGWHRIVVAVAGGAERRARKRLEAYIRNHPDWHLRLYRTPAGFRLLAMHRTFDPHEPAVAECFRALGTDPIYVRMSLNQRCFRARVSPKPWRIGISEHIRPRPGVWPIKPERVPERNRWVNEYERVARGYASCRFLETLGGGGMDPAAQAIQILHDDLCRATSSLPVA